MSASEDSPGAAVPGRDKRRMSSRDSVVLAAGSASSGLLAYVFFVLASRALGAEGAAPVSLLWSYWAIAAAVVTFPVQHWIIRRFEADGHEGTVARSLPTLSVVVAAIAGLSGLVAFVFRQELFDGDGVAFALMVAAVTAGSFLTGVVRGVLSGRRRYRATAASLVCENGLRVVAAALTAWVGGDARAFGLSLVLGSLVSLVWQGSLRFGATPSGAAVVRNPLALVSGVAGGSLIAQIVLTGSPVVLAATGGAPAEVTSLFLALAVWRAPYLVAMGVTPQLTTALTRLAIHGPSRRVVRAGRLTVLTVVAGAVLAAGLGATVLQRVLEIAFGSDVRLAGASLAGLGVATALALGNLVLLLMLLALGRSRMSTLGWLVALAASAIWMLLADISPVPRIVIGFLIAEVTAFAVLAVAVELSASSSARRACSPEKPRSS